MKMIIKRLLKKYEYPLEEVDYIVATVIEQCELWVDNMMSI